MLSKKSVFEDNKCGYTPSMSVIVLIFVFARQPFRDVGKSVHFDFGSQFVSG
jgi:hypothetical protein